VVRPFRTPLAPFVSIMGVLVNGGLMLSLGRDNWIRLFVWLVVGLVIYVGYSRHHSLLTAGQSVPGAR
jgi:APA family basic amino acid/polyamine antiporter